MYRALLCFDLSVCLFSRLQSTPECHSHPNSPETLVLYAYNSVLPSRVGSNLFIGMPTRETIQCLEVVCLIRYNEIRVLCA